MRREKPIFFHQHLHRIGRKLEFGAGRGMVTVDDDKLCQAVLKRIVEDRRRSRGKSSNAGRRGVLPEDDDFDNLSYEEDVVAARAREIGNAHIMLFLYILLTNIESAVALQFVKEVDAGAPTFGDPQIPISVLDYYFAKARHFLGMRAGRHAEDDPWMLVPSYEHLRDDLRRQGVRNASEEAYAQLASRAKIEPEAMERRVKRARARIRSFWAKAEQNRITWKRSRAPQRRR